jgi:hypothetical protein
VRTIFHSHRLKDLRLATRKPSELPAGNAESNLKFIVDCVGAFALFQRPHFLRQSQLIYGFHGNGWGWFALMRKPPIRFCADQAHRHHKSTWSRDAAPWIDI